MIRRYVVSTLSLVTLGLAACARDDQEGAAPEAASEPVLVAEEKTWSPSGDRKSKVSGLPTIQVSVTSKPTSTADPTPRAEVIFLCHAGVANVYVNWFSRLHPDAHTSMTASFDGAASLGETFSISDNEWGVGYWGTAEATPFIQRIMAARSFVASAVTFDGSMREAAFDVSEARVHLARFLERCNDQLSNLADLSRPLWLKKGLLMCSSCDALRSSRDDDRFGCTSFYEHQSVSFVGSYGNHISVLVGDHKLRGCVSHLALTNTEPED